jgi:hypothetical protein
LGMVKIVLIRMSHIQLIRDRLLIGKAHLPCFG